MFQFKQKMIQQDENSEDEDKDNTKVNGINTSGSGETQLKVPVANSETVENDTSNIATNSLPTNVDISENAHVQPINADMQDPLAQEISPSKKVSHKHVNYC